MAIAPDLLFQLQALAKAKKLEDPGRILARDEQEKRYRQSKRARDRAWWLVEVHEANK